MQFIRPRFAFLFGITVLLFISITAHAQKEYFVYLQTDSQKPFYVILNKKTFSSTATGYLILSKLTDGNYPIKVGFAGDSKSLDFDVAVKSGDQGFLIKDFGEKGWGLFNLQTLAVQNAGVEKKKRDEALAVEMEKTRQLLEQKQADSLASVLAENSQKRIADSLQNVQHQLMEKKVADSLAAVQNAALLIHISDSINAITAQKNSESTGVADSLVSKTVTAKSEENKKTDSEKSVNSVSDSTKIISAKMAAIPMITGFSDTSEIQITKIDTATILKSDPLKIGEVKTDSGTTLIYKDGIDTIKLLLPATQLDTIKVMPVSVDTSKVFTETPILIPSENAKKSKSDSPQFLDMEMGSDSTLKMIETKKDTVVSNPEIEKKRTEIEPVGNEKNNKSSGITSNNSYTKIVTPASTDSISTPVNPNCKSVADEKDFFALRKRMAASDDVDAMVSIAKKEFKTKCFNSTQIKNLCVLFLTDADKYAFLDAAYPFVQDPGNYNSLSNLLTDPYFINRFKSMLK